MLTILDYLDKVTETFDEKEVNEVDMLILSQFSMLKFENVLRNVNTDEKNLSFSDILHLISTVTNINKYNCVSDLYKNELFDQLVSFEQDPRNLDLLLKICASRRFRNLLIRFHVDKIELDTEKQFSATCFIHRNRFSVMCFRGTDATLVGWKEDFNLSFKKTIPAQHEAVQYMNTIYRFLPNKLYVCGHSKGGNLAVYASMFCRDDIRKNIEHVYSFDGPGFSHEIAETEAFKSIVDKTTKYVPQESIIGLLLNTAEEIKVLYSDEFWISQHIPYSWEITEEMTFNYIDDVTSSAKRSQSSINDLDRFYSKRKKEEFVNQVYEILIKTGANDIVTIINDLKEYLPIIMKNISGMEKERRELMFDFFTNLGKFQLKHLFNNKGEEVNHA